MKLSDAPADEDAPSGEKSKSQLKREMLALQEMGEELVGLSAAKLRKLALPEALLNAVLEAQAMHQRGARKRQLQYIGKVMRTVDAEPIRQALAALNNPHGQDTAQFHKVERWRERLLSGGDEALEELLADYPQADRQQLRQLLRNAETEAKVNSAPRAARLLFQYLRELLKE